MFRCSRFKFIKNNIHAEIRHDIKRKRTQLKSIPSRIGISFGSDTRPVAFLPRQPVEGDIAIFPEGLSRTVDDSPVIDFDEDLVSDIADQNFSLSPSSPSSHYSNSNHKNILKSQQIPIARLEAAKLGLPKSLLDRLKSPEIGLHHVTPVQAKMLQRAFLLHDCAVSAETGSGKTYGLCVALLAKLLRNGPNRPHSALFLVPSDILVHQVSKWITELWPYEIDRKELIPFSSIRNKNQRLPSIVNSIVATIYSFECPSKAFRTIMLNPKKFPSKIIVVTPEMFWAMYCKKKQKNENYQIRLEQDKKDLVEDLISAGGKNSLAKTELLGYRKKPKFPTHIRAFFPTIDTIVVDEADVVLPCGDLSAAGNLLLAEMTNPIRFKSPIQLLISSATLTPATVGHLRRFLRKNVFATTTSRIFEGDAQKERSFDAQAAKERYWDRSKPVSSFSSLDQIEKENSSTSNNNDESRLTAPPLQLSQNISHRFVAADDENELIRILVAVADKFKKNVLEQEQTFIKMEKSSESEKELKKQISLKESKIEKHEKIEPKKVKSVQRFDEEGYAIMEIESLNEEENKIVDFDSKEEMENERENQEEKEEQQTIEQKKDQKFSPSEKLPKVLIIYPHELKNGIFNSEKSSLSSSSEVKNFFEEKPQDVIVSGGLQSVEQLEEIVGEIFFPSFSEQSSDGVKNNNNNFEVILLSSEQVRGFDQKNTQVVVILSRADSIRDFVHWSGRVGRMGQSGEAVHVLSRTWMRNTAQYCERLGLNFKVEKEI
jgi:hypothetical protein